MTSNISPSVSARYDCRVKGLDLCRALPVCVSWWWFLWFHANKIEQLRTTWYQPFILRRSKCFSNQQMDSKPKCAQVLPTCARQPNLGTIHVIATHVNSTSGATLFTSNSEVREKVALWLQQLTNSIASILIKFQLSNLPLFQASAVSEALDGPWPSFRFLSCQIKILTIS